jgi:hypothetical protein
MLGMLTRRSTKGLSVGLGGTSYAYLISNLDDSELELTRSFNAR